MKRKTTRFTPYTSMHTKKPVYHFSSFFSLQFFDVHVKCEIWQIIFQDDERRKKQRLRNDSNYNCMTKRTFNVSKCDCFEFSLICCWIQYSTTYKHNLYLILAKPSKVTKPIFELRVKTINWFIKIQEALEARNWNLRSKYRSHSTENVNPVLFFHERKCISGLGVMRFRLYLFFLFPIDIFRLCGS